MFWRVGDDAVIDGAFVNGSARLIGWVSGVLSRIQTGYLYGYAFAMVIGLCALTGWMLLSG
jgi:NADH-quinone oxidoreductase subunit L